MDIRELNKVLAEALNESKEDDKNALANFLEIDVKDLEDKPDFYGMSQFSSKEDGETYAISSDEELIEKNVAEHMKNLYDGMSHEEFCKEVVPYLYGDMEDYMTIDFVSMAKDVIDQYGAGHELAYADADTDEVDYNGKTYYIFREDFRKSLKEAVAELGDDASEIAGKIEKEIKDAEWRKKDLKEVLAKFLAVTISYPYKPEAIYKTFIEVMTKLGKAEEGKKVIAEIKSNMDKAASVYADLMQPKINGVPVNRFELINLGNAIEQIFLKGSTTYKLKDSSLEVIKSLGLENALL